MGHVSSNRQLVGMTCSRVSSRGHKTRRAPANLNTMSDQKQPPASEPKQKTLKGYEIPLPRRGETFAAFKKIVAKPQKG
jgi:hypothetical protein